MNKPSNSSSNTQSNAQSNNVFHETSQNQVRKTPNKFLAPVVIAGVTIGFLASAYKFVFTKPKPVKSLQDKPRIDQKTTANH
ncbi:hypothetical protein AMD27_12270 [Acinetobacter sp. TGL-Y2]|nr:hypothetical protein [Acinetobacter sp. TGL-Y2]AMW79584.1 hypothetical protein AMD27_12270 [Acinetobacter sp. TGL-Y2]